MVFNSLVSRKQIHIILNGFLETAEWLHKSTDYNSILYVFCIMYILNSNYTFSGRMSQLNTKMVRNLKGDIFENESETSSV